MKILYTLTGGMIICLFGVLPLYAQVGIGTTTPNAHAMLDIVSSTKGLLLPRLTTAQQTTLANSLGNQQRGLLVTDAATGKPIVWMGNSSGWQDAAAASTTATTPLVISSTNTLSINAGTQSGDLITWDGNNWVNKQPAQQFNLTVGNLQPYLAINYCIAAQGIFPSQNADEPFIGELGLFGFNFAPKGWLQCNGQLLSLQQNVALFSLLGTQYGGNGFNNFALPDLRGRVPMHQGTGASSYTIGDNGGVETNTITH